MRNLFKLKSSKEEVKGKEKELPTSTKSKKEESQELEPQLQHEFCDDDEDLGYC